MAQSDTHVSLGPAASDAPGPDRHDVPAAGRSGFTLVAGRQVHYLEWGGVHRPAVLALHGGGQTAYMFEDLGAGLRETHHVLAPDLPGHGDSDRLTGGEPFGRQALAGALPPLLAEFGMSRTAVVGASLGGITALTLARSRPELVTAVVLVDVGHQLEEQGVQRIIDFIRRHQSFGSLEEAADAVAEYLPHRERTDPQRLRRNLRQRADGRWTWKHGMTGRWQRDGNWRRILDGLAEDAAQVRVPVLVLRGSRSDVLSAAGADAVAAVLPNATVAEVSAAGHLAAGDNPDRTVGLIRDFLAGIGW